jgi:AsmA protein
MNPVTADIYGGKESGNIAIDMRPAQPVYSVKLKTDKVDANRLISSVSSLKQTLYGLLAANVAGSFSSNSSDAIARSMNGEIELNLTNGKLMNLDLLHELGTVGKFLGSFPAKSRNLTSLSQLSGTFTVRDGVARTNNLKAVIDGGTIAATGQVNLADQSLNLRVTAVLNKTLSQQVGGSQIGGLMNTALANGQNELVLPIMITGTFQHPQVTPDAQQVAEMKLQNLLPTTNNPAELTSGILGDLPASKNKNQSGGSRRQQKSATGTVLNARNRKSQQQTASAPAPTPTSKK